MNNSNFLKALILATILIVGFVFIFTQIGYSQFYPSPLPICLTYYPGLGCYDHLFYSDYGYFNSINGFLLGYMPFTPFLTQNLYGASYNLAGIHTYPYLGSPYQNPFPYSTLAGIPIPYARFDYPTYTYGVPDFYLSWVLMQ